MFHWTYVLSILHDMGLTDSSAGSVLFIELHTAALRLIQRSGLDVPTFATRRLHVRAPRGGRWNCGQEMSGNFAEMTTSMPFRDILHAIKL